MVEVPKHIRILLASAIIISILALMTHMMNSSMGLGADATPEEACKTAIEMQMQTASAQGAESILISGTCFDENDEPVIEELSGAEPGDSLNVSGSKNYTDMAEEDYEVIKK